MRFVLLPKCDQQSARRVSQRCFDLLPAVLRESPETSLRTTFRVALCQECRIRGLDPNPTEANYFVDLCRFLERPGTAVDVLRVFFVEPPPYALEIVQT